MKTTYSTAAVLIFLLYPYAGEAILSRPAAGGGLLYVAYLFVRLKASILAVL